jgi:hypothetical protein
VSRWSSDSSSPSSGTGSPSPPRKTTITTTATAVPTAINVADYLHGLCVTIHSDTPPRPETVVNADSPLFLSVAAAINLGLRMLESKRGKEGLIQLGVLVVNDWAKTRTSHIYPPAQLPATHANMAPNVTAYLKKMRSNFVPIFLTNDCTGEGAAHKVNWAQPTAGQPEKELADYVGSQAGIMRLNKFVCIPTSFSPPFYTFLSCSPFPPLFSPCSFFSLFTFLPFPQLSSIFLSFLRFPFILFLMMFFPPILNHLSLSTIYIPD